MAGIQLCRRSGRIRRRSFRLFFRRFLRLSPLQDGGKLRDFLPHDFSGLEFHCGPRRNDEAAPRLIRIPANPRLGQADFEDAEIAQLDRVSVGECIGDLVKRALHDIEHLLLHHPGVVTDLNYKIPFRQCAHNDRELRTGSALRKRPLMTAVLISRAEAERDNGSGQSRGPS